jgi:hypothetical protein
LSFRSAAKESALFVILTLSVAEGDESPHLLSPSSLPVILGFAQNLRSCITVAVVLASAVVLAFEIGPGLSPDIQRRHNTGFSPWDMLSYGV